MPVDQGGLRYNLEVTDNFSGATENFRTEMDQGKTSLDNFRSSLTSFNNAARDSKVGMKSLATAQGKINTLMDGLGKKVKEYKNQVRFATTAEKKLTKAQAATVKQGKGFSKERKRQVDAVKAQGKAAAVLAKAQERLAKASGRALANSKKQRDATRRVIATSKLARTTFIKEAAAIRKLSRQRRADAAAAIRQARAIGAVHARLTGAQAIQNRPQVRAFTDKAQITRLRAARAGFLGVENASRSAGRQVSGFNRIFTRLTSAFIFFAAARGVVNGFKSIILSAISFNSVIEQSTLGIAALIVAVGEVRDVTGEVTGSTRQLALAQREARRQVALLRKEGLRTAATFEQLTQAFQTAIAPGLQAGLDLDEIRKFTVRISQAAAAIGLPQNQLAEEIRSLLGGAITPRQTRIATSLGLTNADIARFKELGTLSQELEDRFSAFAIAGKEALGTFTALITNTKDALQQLASAAGLDFFNELKEVFKDIQKSIVEVGEEGIIINPDAIALLRIFFNGLQRAVQVARELGNELSFEDLAVTARLVGGSFEVAAIAVSALVQGFLRGMNDLARIFNAIRNQILKLAKENNVLIDVSNIKEGLRLMAEIAVVYLGILISTKLLTAALVFIILPIKAVLVAISAIGAVMTGITALAGLITGSFFTVLLPIVLIGAALGTGAFFLKQWLDDVTGVTLKFESLLKIVQGIPSLFKVLGTAIRLVVNTSLSGVFLALQFAASETLSFILNKSADALDAIGRRIAIFNRGLGKSFRDGASELRKAAKRVEGTFDELADKRNKLFKRDQKAAADALKEVSDLVFGAAANNENARTLKDFFEAAAESGSEILIEGLKGILGKLGIEDFADSLFKASKEEAESLVSILENLPPVIGQANSGLKGFKSTLVSLQDDARKTGELLEAGIDSLGAGGAGLSQQRTLLEGLRKLRDATLKTDQLITAERAKQASLNAQSLRTDQRINTLSDERFSVITSSVVLGKELARVQSKVSQEEVRAGAARIAQSRAIREFDSEKVAAQEEVLAVSERELDVLKEKESLLKKQLLAIDDIRLKDSSEEDLALIAKRISLDGRIKLNEEDLLTLLKARITIEKNINEAIADRIVLTSRQEVRALQQGVAERRSELDVARKLFAVRGSLNDLEIRGAQEQSDVAEQLLRVNFLKAQQEANLNLLNINIENTESDRARNALLEQRTELIKANGAEMELELEILKQQRAEAKAINDIAEEPIKFGFLAAIVDFSGDAISTFKTTLQVMTTLLEGVANIWSDVIGAALDPSQGPVNILAKFQDLLNQIVQQIITAFLKAQAFKLLTSVFGFSTGDLQTLGLGRAEGGSIPKRGGKAMPSPAHAFAHGYVDGGSIHKKISRPRGLDPRDTVPIWAQPGEHMMPVKRVMSYGLDLLEGMRRGIIDPKAIRAAAGLGPRTTRVMRAPVGHSLASGGTVSRSGAPAAGRDGRPKIVNVVSPELVPNELVSDDGQETILNVIRANSEEL